MKFEFCRNCLEKLYQKITYIASLNLSTEYYKQLVEKSRFG
ncbi:MAG TPA: hypothetical protein DCM38_04775 [Gammaproteobacteria bacterium]|nr:hypothetical protein [Gammaproteobacteria bacterium]